MCPSNPFRGRCRISDLSHATPVNTAKSNCIDSRDRFVKQSFSDCAHEIHGIADNIFIKNVGVNQGEMLNCHGAKNVHIENVWSEGIPWKYFLITADNPTESFFWDNSASKKLIRQGNNEAAVRWMQCLYAHVIGIKVTGSWHRDASGHLARWKQAAQIRPMGKPGLKCDQFIAENWDIDGTIDIGNIKDVQDVNYPFGTYDRVRLVGCKMAGVSKTFGVKLIELVDCNVNGKLVKYKKL